MGGGPDGLFHRAQWHAQRGSGVQKNVSRTKVIAQSYSKARDFCLSALAFLVNKVPAGGFLLFYYLLL